MPHPRPPTAGLWPNDFNGDYPCNCGSQTFNLSAVTSLLPELHEYWPSYKCADDDNCNSGFWGHEWTKHGVRASGRLRRLRAPSWRAGTSPPRRALADVHGGRLWRQRRVRLL